MFVFYFIQLYTQNIKLIEHQINTSYNISDLSDWMTTINSIDYSNNRYQIDVIIKLKEDVEYVIRYF